MPEFLNDLLVVVNSIPQNIKCLVLNEGENWAKTKHSIIEVAHKNLDWLKHKNHM